MNQFNSLLISKLTQRQMNAEDDYLVRFEMNPFDALMEEPNYRELAFQKFENLLKYGITAQEFQDLLVVLLILRFIIYSIKYNPITSFKMCCIGGFSAYLWLTVFLNHVGRYMPFMPDHLYMANLHEEQYIRVMDAYKRGTQRGIEEAVALTVTDPSELPFWSILRFKILFRELMSDSVIPLGKYTLQKIHSLIPQSFLDSIDPFYSYFMKTFYPRIKRFCINQATPLYGMITYTTIVRIGKRYCPYHIRWHYTFVIIHSQISRPVYDLIYRAQMYILNVLLPQRRFEEAETMSIYIGVIVWVHLTFLILATLHALFSQYFFVPFIGEAVEMHVGPRPKRSIWSGGYTAWQDQTAFYKREFDLFGDSTRLWWGWLGRGVDKLPPKKKRRKRRWRWRWRK